MSLLLASIVPLFFFSVILLITEYYIQQEQTYLLQKEKSIQISEHIKEYFSKLENNMNFLCKMTPFISVNLEKKKDLLSRLILQENQFERFSLRDNNAKELFYTDRLVPYVKSQEPQYINKKLIYKAFRDKKNYFDQMHFSTSTYEPLIDATFLLKNTQTLKIENMLVVTMRMKKIWEYLSSVTHLSGEDIFVTNSKDIILAHKNPSVVIKKTSAISASKKGLIKDRNNNYVLRSVKSFKIKGFEFNVIVQRNIANAFSKFLYIFLYSFTLSMLLVVFIFLVIKHIDKSIINPLLSLSNVATMLSQGNLSKKADVYGNDELSFLAVTFNEMSEKISKTMNSLKDEIKLKTVIQNDLENSEKRLLAIINNTNSIIYLKDKNENYVMVNDEFLKFVNKSREDVINHHISTIFSGDKLSSCLAKDTQIKLNKEVIISEEKFVGYNVEERCFLINRFPIFDNGGNLINIAGVATDITELKKIQNKLEDFNKDLEKKILKKTQDLTNANKKLEKTIKSLHKTQEQLIFSEKIASLGRLVSGVAHEINTPLGIALTGLSYLDEITISINELHNDGNMSQDEFERYLKTAKQLSHQSLSNIERATHLVQTFKQLSVTNFDEEKRKINIYQYTEGLIASIEEETKNSKVVIQNNISKEINIHTYAGAYGQVISNLITNSLTHGYGNEGKGTITISIEKLDKNLKIIYTDDGIGIDKEHLSHIFEPFFTTQRHSGGTGLGLNILYNIVRQQLKGEVTCKSELGHGVCFEIVIPNK
ncbi:ATP-binding protein [Sulfurospirillum arcachonense]|uniref:ATP-binding protein n=1 Tax=Sulfurospirillum arcachonense TaxID=57666 RepID=UPI0004B60C15|nr:ATP-binding protein [Sulfurospirillum arcachonense]